VTRPRNAQRGRSRAIHANPRSSATLLKDWRLLRARGAYPDAGLVKALLILVRRSPNQQFWRDPAPTAIAWQLAGVALASLTLCIEFPPLAGLTHLAAPPIRVAPSAPGGIVSTIWWDSFKP
jgi:hypothetical protein